MKKLLLLAAMAMIAIVSCNKPDDEKEKESQTPEVKTAAENLVAHFSFEANETPGTGISMVESKGSASMDAAGYIGKGWTNTSGTNTTQAYTKYALAATNPFTGLTDMTFTAWIKLKEECSKGAILSVNGSGIDWPAFIAYFDNTRVPEETGVKEQQVNGRVVLHDAEGNEQNIWLDTYDAAFAKYGNWFQFAFTYTAATGAWALYVDGVKVKDAEFGPKLPIGGFVTGNTNALYVGGWASFIEGASSESWQSFFAGSIDEVRIFNKALTEAELQALRKEEVAIALL